MEEKNKNIVLSLDISTKTIGICLLYDDGSDDIKIINLTHINPKAEKKKVKGIEELFLKKRCFEEYIQQFKDFGITKAVIEEPLLSSNNSNTVATLLRFNGMISDVIYNIFGVVPDYISSYDARAYSFPELMAIRKYAKDGTPYENSKVLKSIKQSNFVLFGSYPWTIDKKEVIQQKIAEIYPNIEWKYNKNGELIKENFDASDAAVAGIAQIKKERYGVINPTVENIITYDDKVEYDVLYWNKKEHRTTYLNNKDIEKELKEIKNKKKITKEA